VDSALRQLGLGPIAGYGWNDRVWRQVRQTDRSMSWPV